MGRGPTSHSLADPGSVRDGVIGRDMMESFSGHEVVKITSPHITSCGLAAWSRSALAMPITAFGRVESQHHEFVPRRFGLFLDDD